MIRFLLSLVVWWLRAVVGQRGALVLENLALRQQLATYARGQKRPQVKPEERLFWVVLSKGWCGWRSTLLIVKPATVIGWHQRLYRGYWRWRSRKSGRPPIPYGAPNASPHAERFNRTLEEALNHFIFLNVRHVLRVCREYMEYYHRARPSQALHAIPDPYP